MLEECDRIPRFFCAAAAIRNRGPRFQGDCRQSRLYPAADPAPAWDSDRILARIVHWPCRDLTRFYRSLALNSRGSTLQRALSGEAGTINYGAAAGQAVNAFWAKIRFLMFAMA